MRRLAPICPLSFIAALLLSACGNEPRQTTIISLSDAIDTGMVLAGDTVFPIEREVPIPENIDSNFNDFLFLFFTSARFQEQRISFPLPVAARSGDLIITQSEWQSFPIDIGQMPFVSCFESMAGLTEEVAALRQVDVAMIDGRRDSVVFHHFARPDTKWRLHNVREGSILSHSEGEFLKFFHRFATDSLFQLRHLSSTLAFTMIDPTGDADRITGYIDRSQWTAFCPALPDSIFYYIDYGQTLRPRTDRIVSIQAIATGDLVMLYFKRTSTTWLLYKLEE